MWVQPIQVFIICSFWGVFWTYFCSVTQSCPTFVIPGTAGCQALLSLTSSWSLLKFMSIQSVMLSNHLILCHLLLLLPSIFPSTRVFSSELALPIRWPKTGTSASASILPMNIQGWFLLGLTGLISLLSKGLSGDSPAPQFESISSLAVSFLYGPTLTSVHDYWKKKKKYSFDSTDLCLQSDVSAF